MFRTYRSISFLFLFASALLAQKPFQNGQAARAVVGQITFTVGNNNPSQQTLGGASGIAWAGNRLYVADSNRVGASPLDDRVLVFDTTLIPSAYTDLATDTALYGQTACFVCGTQASLILGQNTFNPPTFTPTTPVGSPAETAYYPGVNGTQDPAGTSATENPWLNNASAVGSDGIRLAVADTDNNRVLIWTTIPTSNNQPPNLVLGQPNLATVQPQQQGVVSATTMRGPQGVWIANNRLYVADTQNYRVLIWNTFPTSNDQAPDVVLGQPDFTHANGPTPSSSATPTAANQLLNPVSVTADSSHVYVADLGNNRVLIWNTISPGMDQNADVVVGQPDFVNSAANNPTVCANLKTGPSTSVTTVTGTTVTLPGPCSASLNFPRFALSDGTRLFVADGGNDRVLIYNAIPTKNTALPNNVLGQVTFYNDIVSSASISIVSTAVDNTGGVDTTPSPTSLAWDGTNLYVADPFNRRVLIFTAGDTLLPSAFDPAAKVVPVVNWASEIVRQEGTVALSLATGGTITANDTATITIQGTAYAYTEKSGDTLDGICRALVKLIDASDKNVTATFAGAGTATIYLSSINTNLGYDTITLAATTSNTANVVATASGSYLSAGNGATVSPGTLIEVNAPPGVTFTDNPTPVTGTLGPQVPATLDGVQLYLDGIASPLYKVSQTQIIGQIPYFFGATRNSTSVYVRTVHNDGTVTATNATPVYIAPANPGIFNAPQSPRQIRPWPASMAYHQLNNPTAVVSVDGSVKAGDTGTITIASTGYTYTVLSTDTLATVVTAFVKLINNGSKPDPNVVASAGGAFTRVVLTSKKDGFHGGNGISISTSTSTAADLTLTAYTSATCCAVQNGSVISPSNPAVDGELISISTAGLGSIVDVNGTYINLNTGQPFPGPGTDDVEPANFVAATMGAETAQVIYAGLPVGSYGTYRVDLIVPSDLPANDITQLYIAQNAFISNTVTMAVGAAVANPPPPPVSVSQPFIFMSIDAPQTGQTISGVFHVGGWALDTNYPVANVTLAVDGITYLTAGYGGLRPDACVHHTGLNCPNVGYDALLDTAAVGNGVHTFQVTVTDTAGNSFTSATSNVTIKNNPASYPTHLGIDVPFAGVTYHGVVAFSGWAVNDTSPIVGFNGYIDALPINAYAVSYGGARPDVCAPAAYPGRPGCPNVGWNYLADLTVVGNGNHTFSLTAIAANGQIYTAIIPFVVADFTAASTSGTRVNIDTPNGKSTLNGVTPIGGWAINPKTTIESLQIRVDDVFYSSPAYGGVRKDVCRVYVPGCPHVGFNGQLDTTVLSDGTHTLQVIGLPREGQPYIATRPILVNNQAVTGIGIGIDVPNAVSPNLMGITGIAGWAVGSSSPVQTVTISVDRVLNGTAVYGGLRPDVCTVHPGRPACPNVGWNYTLDTTNLTSGLHTLEVTSATASGQRATAAMYFNVTNASAAARVTIDAPGPANNPYAGLASMSGSALNANAHIVSVLISVDGIPLGDAAYGTARPDVCTSVSVSPDCPNVGWTYALDTTVFMDGPHTFGVLATAADGTTSSAVSLFSIANSTAVTPMIIDIDSPGTSLSRSYTGAVIFGGWLREKSASIQSVFVSVDGIPFGNAGVHGYRPDVCTSTSVSPDCPNTGWTILLNTGRLSNDIHTLTVTGTTVAGQSYSVSRQFTAAN